MKGTEVKQGCVPIVIGAGGEASAGVGAPACVRHHPERTRLYQLVEEYNLAFKAVRTAQ